MEEVWKMAEAEGRAIREEGRGVKKGQKGGKGQGREAGQGVESKPV